MNVKRLWFVLLLASITMEGIGRKYVPAISQGTWYFAKDLILLGALPIAGLGRAEANAVRRAMGAFLFVLPIAFGWTVLQLLNPAHQSAMLGLLGLRAYWFWWIAPVLVAGMLREPSDLAFALNALAVTAVIVAATAAFQFRNPVDADINRYAWTSGDMAVATFRGGAYARVASTFSYISGFSNFAIVSIPVLLALGLGEAFGQSRILVLAGLMALAGTVPMTGSRGPVVQVAASSALIISLAGLLRRRTMAYIVPGVIVIAIAGAFASSEAVLGLAERFEYSDTEGRFQELLQVLPPVALQSYNYPVEGIGTGMMQNVRLFLGVDTGWATEGEVGRYLVELGVVGYLLIWTSRLGLAVALGRAAIRLRRGGWAASGALAVVLAVLALISNLVFDHVNQALFFLAVGMVVRQVVSMEKAAGSRA